MVGADAIRLVLPGGLHDAASDRTIAEYAQTECALMPLPYLLAGKAQDHIGSQPGDFVP